MRGIIVAKPSTPLSHINILAKGWDVPNVYIKDADKLYKDYNTWWVKLDANLTDYKIKRLPILNDAKKKKDTKIAGQF